MLPLLFQIYFFIQPCKAQECKSVQKLEAKDGLAYMGIVDTPKNINTTDNQIFLLFLGKGVTKTDTTYLLSVGINTVAVSKNTPSMGILLQFEDGSEIAKPNQMLEVVSTTADKAILSTEVDLTLEEIHQMENKPLVNITLASSKVVLIKSLSKSVRAVASCLPVTW